MTMYPIRVDYKGKKTVYANGGLLGETNVEAMLNQGTHEITLNGADYTPKSYEITVPGDPDELDSKGVLVIDKFRPLASTKRKKKNAK